VETFGKLLIAISGMGLIAFAYSETGSGFVILGLLLVATMLALAPDKEVNILSAGFVALVGNILIGLAIDQSGSGWWLLAILFTIPITSQM